MRASANALHRGRGRRILGTMTGYVHEVTPRWATNIAFAAGHYLAAVAEYLLAEGVPVSEIGVEPPSTEKDEKGRAVRFTEVSGTIGLTGDLCEALSGHRDAWAYLDWSGLCGWALEREGRESLWLGAGLVPAPGRVAAFLLAVQVHPEEAGSLDRPGYRDGTEDYDLLAGKLTEYLPARSEELPGKRNYELKFKLAHRRAYEERIARELLDQGPDPVIELPVRRSELRALAHVLEYGEGLGGAGFGGLMGALRRDLAGRVPGRADSADHSRSALQEAKDDQARKRPAADTA
jgi:hypothetical protein